MSIDSAIDKMSNSLKSVTGVTVSVTHNSSTQDIVAIPGRTNFRTTDRSGQSVLIPTRDYLIHIDDWPFASMPDRGTTFEETYYGTTYTYRVSTPNSEDLWRWTTPSRKQIRVHTTLVGES